MWSWHAQAASCGLFWHQLLTAFCIFNVSKKICFFCHAQMKTMFKMPLFFGDRNPLFPSIPPAVKLCSVKQKKHEGCSCDPSYCMVGLGTTAGDAAATQLGQKNFPR